MNYIYLEDKDARKLFLNKYLKCKEFNKGKRKRSDHLSFHFRSQSEPLHDDDGEIIFLSQFDYVSIASQNDLKVYIKNYNIPFGFFNSDGGTKNAFTLFESENQEINIDKTFLAYRRALLNTFIEFHSESVSKLRKWLKLYNKFENNLPAPFEELFNAITDLKDFPSVRATGKLAREPKSVLQFIYLGRKFFSDDSDKYDEEHKNWMKKLNPEGDIEILKVPEKFQSVSELIIGYVLAIRFEASNRKSKYSDIKEPENGIVYRNKKELNEDEIEFYKWFWSGLLDQNLNNHFHTPDSAEILFAIELKAYNFLNNTADFGYKFDEITISDIVKTKSDDKRSVNARFRKYCELLAGEKPELKTKDELIETATSFDINSKKTLLFFLSNDNYLYRLNDILNAFKYTDNILLVYKYGMSKLSGDANLSIDIILGRLKKEIAQFGSGLNVEVIGKNLDRDDDRDIINNLKAFIKKYCPEHNFLYASDATKKEDKLREKEWLGKSLSPTPLFNENEDYLFIN